MSLVRPTSYAERTPTPLIFPSPKRVIYAVFFKIPVFTALIVLPCRKRVNVYRAHFDRVLLRHLRFSDIIIDIFGKSDYTDRIYIRAWCVCVCACVCVCTGISNIRRACIQLKYAHYDLSKCLCGTRAWNGL